MVDDFTIEFTSTKPDAVVYLNSAIISILPKHLLESGPLDDPDAFGQMDFFLKQPVGTGPFKVANYVEDQMWNLCATRAISGAHPILKRSTG